MRTVVPIYVEHWGDNCDFFQFCRIFNIGGMKLDQKFFYVSKLSEDQKEKRSSSKVEEFLSPNLSEDQKKGLHRKLKSFCLRNYMKTKKRSKHHPALRCRP